MQRGILLLVLATLLWGGNYICGRFLGPALPATLLNTIRWGISTVILAGILFMNKKPFPIFAYWKKFMILGFLGVFSFSTLNYLGLRTISASEAGMISAGIPVTILLFSPFILQDRISKKAWIGTIVSIFGVIVLFLGKTATPSSHGSLLGEFEIILSCFAWGLYTVLGKRYGIHIDPLTMTAGAAFYGTLFSAISCIGTTKANLIHMSGLAWICVIYVSTLASIVAYFSWNAGVKLVGAGTAAPYINLLPVWTVIFGQVILQEQMTILSLAGGILTIIGAVLTTLKSKGKMKNKQLVS